MVNGMPEPALLGFLANKTPHFVDFSFFHFVDLDEDLAWIQALDHYRVDVLELRRFFLTQQ
jgi:hypothetical protein